MNRTIKWTSAVLGLLVLGLLAFVAAVMLLLDPNDFKPLLIAQFKQYTGAEMQIPGNLSWTFIPHVGLEAAEVKINHAPDYSAHLKNLVVQVKVGPLLQKQLEFSKVSIEEMQLNQLHLSHVSAKLRIYNNMLEIEPLTAELYQGNLSSGAKITMKQSSPNTHLLSNIQNVAFAQFIAGLSGKKAKLQLDGQANIAMDVTMNGKTQDELLQQLNGSGRLNLSHGVLRGIDISYYVETAAALVNKQNLPTRSPNNETAFGEVSGTGHIENGILYNNDLVLDSPLYTVKGKGSIDLINKTLNYHLEVVAKPGKVNEKLLGLYGKTVPITVSGSLEDPTVSLDTLALMREIGKEQLQKVGEQIQKALPDKANKFIKSLFQ